MFVGSQFASLPYIYQMISQVTHQCLQTLNWFVGIQLRTQTSTSQIHVLFCVCFSRYPQFSGTAINTGDPGSSYQLVYTYSPLTGCKQWNVGGWRSSQNENPWRIIENIKSTSDSGRLRAGNMLGTGRITEGTSISFLINILPPPLLFLMQRSFKHCLKWATWIVVITQLSRVNMFIGSWETTQSSRGASVGFASHKKNEVGEFFVCGYKELL